MMEAIGNLTIGEQRSSESFAVSFKSEKLLDAIRNLNGKLVCELVELRVICINFENAGEPGLETS